MQIASIKPRNLQLAKSTYFVTTGNCDLRQWNELENIKTGLAGGPGRKHPGVNCISGLSRASRPTGLIPDPGYAIDWNLTAINFIL